MKRELNYIIPIVAIGFLFLFFMMNVPMTGKVVEEPPIINNCSNESIKYVWESIFKGNSENVTITFTSEEDEIVDNMLPSEMYQLPKCREFRAYQIIGTKVRMLRKLEASLLGNDFLMVGEADFKPEKIENFTLFLENLPEESMYYLFYINESDLSIRDVATAEQAESIFESTFNVDSSNWTLDQEIVKDVYTFSENSTMENITIFGESINPEGIFSKGGIIYKNYSMNEYFYSAGGLFGSVKYLSDKYENWTSFINTTVEGVKIKNNNSELTITDFDFLWSILFGANYLESQKIEILQNDKQIIETEINFTEYFNSTTFESSFDWKKVILKKQPSNSEVGYIIINGINETKNVTVDKLSSESDSVCIKNAEINSISEIGEDCDASDEYLLDCPGTLDNFTCEIINNTFFVTGLEHSAVLEFLPYEEVCIPNWNCDLWTDNKNKCGYRDCEDINNCNNITGMPEEYKTCPVVCIPNWDCTNWEPEKCPKEEERTRTCKDLNNCNSGANKPSNSQSCERDNKIWLWILLGILVLLIGIALIIGLRSPRRHKPIQEQTHNPHPDDEQHEEEFPDENQQTYVPEKKDNNFQEFKQNKRLQENPKDNSDNFFPAEDIDFKKFP